MTTWCRQAIIVTLCAVGWSAAVHAYPSTERRPSGLSQPPLDLGLQTATGYRLDNDEQLLYLSSGQTLRIIDLATFALTSTTPYDISSDTSLSGAIKGVAVDTVNGLLYATQEGGKLLVYEQSDPSSKPTQQTIASGKTLTLAEYDPDGAQLYILNETDRALLRYNPSTQTPLSIPLTATTGTTFTVNAMTFVRNVSGSTGALYCSTTNGRLFVLSASGTVASPITLDATLQQNLKGLAAHPNSGSIYVVNSSLKSVQRVSTTTNTLLSTIDLSANSDLDQLVVADVTNPSATYGFVVGSNGLSMFNADTGEVFDLGSTSTLGEPLSVSGTGPAIASDDGYLYLSYGKIAVVTDNPFVTINSVTYDSGSTLSTSGSVTLSVQTDEAGTYDLRIGGDTRTKGSALVDSSGNASGSIAADTAVSLTIPYSSNASLWSEGSNRVYVFVTDSAGNEGRRATVVTVDTPPPTVAITSVGFGNEKLYVNLERLSQSDIASYRVYADTDPTVVLTKAEIAGSTAQSAVGSTPTVTVAGLTNGSTYYLAAEAVDNTGNISATRTAVLSTGAAATASPEATYGPAGLAGEAGCSLLLQGNAK
ncbi:MAG: hypothetical protein HY696_01760 [Deltaproteobacteria bacterium]|nr:hypothetical protein [Deltaproteobacteria bacterium]